MQKELKPGRSSAGQKNPPGDSDLSMRVAALGEQFVRFRKKYPRGTRFPEALCKAAVDLWAEGARPSELARTCRVTWNQLETWRAREANTRQTTPGEDVRVFTVVDGPQHHGATMEGVLELRLGAWSVSVRLAERG